MPGIGFCEEMELWELCIVTNNNINKTKRISLSIFDQLLSLPVLSMFFMYFAFTPFAVGEDVFCTYVHESRKNISAIFVEDGTSSQEEKLQLRVTCTRGFLVLVGHENLRSMGPRRRPDTF